MKIEVTKYGDPVLRRKGRHVDEITPEIIALVENMLESMITAEGVGLAAQQGEKFANFCHRDSSFRSSFLDGDSRESGGSSSAYAHGFN
jgi:hypothetical protein